jgi:hypothetical protein
MVGQDVEVVHWPEDMVTRRSILALLVEAITAVIDHNARCAASMVILLIAASTNLMRIVCRSKDTLVESLLARM